MLDAIYTDWSLYLVTPKARITPFKQNLSIRKGRDEEALPEFLGSEYIIDFLYPAWSRREIKSSRFWWLEVKGKNGEDNAVYDFREQVMNYAYVDDKGKLSPLVIWKEGISLIETTSSETLRLVLKMLAVQLTSSILFMTKHTL